MRETIYALRCDFLCLQEILRASGPGRGRPVLIGILACLFGFHPITLECSTFTKLTTCSQRSPLVSLFCCPVARGGSKRGNRQTDRHIYEPSTATLAVHAHRGLLSAYPQNCYGRFQILTLAGMIGLEPAGTLIWTNTVLCISLKSATHAACNENHIVVNAF